MLQRQAVPHSLSDCVACQSRARVHACDMKMNEDLKNGDSFIHLDFSSIKLNHMQTIATRLDSLPFKMMDARMRLQGRFHRLT